MSIMKRITLEEEMKKNSQLKLSDIQLLREWCEKQPHLPKIEDSFLVLFLHKNYYHMEPTKKIIEKYYSTRTCFSDYFCNRDVLEEKELRQQGYKNTIVLSLNGVTKDGYKMMYGTYRDTDSSGYIFKNDMKYFTMLTDIRFLRDGANDGYVYITDYSKLSLGHAVKMTPLEMKRCLYYIQEAAPMHLRGVHILNSPSVMEMIMNIARPFIKKELMDMIHFHSSLESASEYFPLDALPNESGGKAGTLQELVEIQMKQFEEYREWFLLDETTRRVNDNLRIGENKSSCNMLFGIDGSFKKLDID